MTTNTWKAKDEIPNDDFMEMGRILFAAPDSLAEHEHQFIHRCDNGAGKSPEKRLMLAVLRDAIRDLTTKNQKLRREALQWFASEEEDWFLSFRGIVGILFPHVSPDRIKKAVMANPDNCLKRLPE